VVREFHDYDGQCLSPGQWIEFDFYNYVPYEAGYTFSCGGETVLRLSGDIAGDLDVIAHPELYFVLPRPRLAWYTNGPALPVTAKFTDLNGRTFEPGEELLWAVHERDQSQLVHLFHGHSGLVLQLDEQNPDHAAVLLYPERFFELPFDARPE
jgi:hypothetical protein